MKKKKILHIPFGGLGNGGVSAVIFSIVSELSDRFSFDCVVFDKKGNREEDFQQYGGALHRIRGYRNEQNKANLFEVMTRPVRFVFSVYRLCKKERYDVVHVHNGREEGWCLLGARLAGVKIRIAHSHNAASPQKARRIIRFLDGVNRFLMRKNATDFVGCSQKACEDFFGKEVPYRVILNSVDLSRFDCLGRKEEDFPRFVHVGRYCYQKNQEYVLQTFAQVKKSFPDATLRLIGFGEEKNKLELLKTELGLGEEVCFIPGDRADIAQEFRGSDWMIFPSRFEGFGIALVEAQASGVYCFASEAVQREADAGGLAFLDLSQGPEAWATSIAKRIRETTALEWYSRENLKKYDSKVIAKEYESIYDTK